MTMLIAELAVETGIAPSELIALDTRMLKAILEVFRLKAKEAKANARSHRRI